MDGAMCPDKEAVPSAKLIQCDAQTLVSVRPFGFEHILALIFITFSLSIAGVNSVSAIQNGLYQDAFVNLGGGILIACLFSLILMPKSLHIDVAMRIYQIRSGWGPLRKEKQGTWEDFERLGMRQYYPEVATFSKGVTTLFLHWRDAKQQPYPLHTTGNVEAKRQSLIAAALLGLPLVDGKGKAISPAPAPPA